MIFKSAAVASLLLLGQQTATNAFVSPSSRRQANSQLNSFAGFNYVATILSDNISLW
jgi:hypothetical protein